MNPCVCVASLSRAAQQHTSGTGVLHVTRAAQVLGRRRTPRGPPEVRNPRRGAAESKSLRHVRGYMLANLSTEWAKTPPPLFFFVFPHYDEQIYIYIYVYACLTHKKPPPANKHIHAQHTWLFWSVVRTCCAPQNKCCAAPNTPPAACCYAKTQS